MNQHSYYIKLVSNIILILLIFISCQQEKEFTPIEQYLFRKTNRDPKFKEKKYIMVPSSSCPGCVKYLVPKIIKVLNKCPDYVLVTSSKIDSIRSIISSHQLILDEIGELDRVKGVTELIICNFKNDEQLITKLTLENYEQKLNEIVKTCLH